MTIKTVLFPNEKLNVNGDKKNKDILELSNEEINENYVKGRIRIVTEQARYTLPSIPRMVKSKNYELNPEFQRRYRWSPEKQSKLIESFIMNVPVPPVFLYEYKYSFYEVMDGLQRLTAINEFYDDKLVLEGLDEWPELNGRKYTELPNKIKAGIDRRYLSSIILMYETAKSNDEADILKQKVFERINTGGELLLPQESRNAIFDGPLNKLCIKLSRNRYLCKMWNIPEPTEEEIKEEKISSELLETEHYRKMFDVELVLRFFEYRQRNDNIGTFKKRLDTYLEYGNKYPEELLTNLEELFTDTIKLVFETFGEKAFSLWREGSNKLNLRKRTTTLVYDPLMYVFSQHLADAEIIVKHRGEVRTKIKDFYEEYYANFRGRDTAKKYQEKRIELFEQLITEIIGSKHAG